MAGVNSPNPAEGLLSALIGRFRALGGVNFAYSAASGADASGGLRVVMGNLAKVIALRDVADKGWLDLATGRYDDVADEKLNEFITQLGDHAALARPAD